MSNSFLTSFLEDMAAALPDLSEIETIAEEVDAFIQNTLHGTGGVTKVNNLLTLGATIVASTAKIAADVSAANAAANPPPPPPPAPTNSSQGINASTATPEVAAGSTTAAVAAVTNTGS